MKHFFPQDHQNDHKNTSKQKPRKMLLKNKYKRKFIHFPTTTHPYLLPNIYLHIKGSFRQFSTGFHMNSISPWSISRGPQAKFTLVINIILSYDHLYSMK